MDQSLPPLPRNLRNWLLDPAATILDPGDLLYRRQRIIPQRRFFPRLRDGRPSDFVRSQLWWNFAADPFLRECCAVGFGCAVYRLLDQTYSGGVSGGWE